VLLRSNSGNTEEEDRPALIKEVTCNPAPKPGLNLTASKSLFEEDEDSDDEVYIIRSTPPTMAPQVYHPSARVKTEPADSIQRL